MKAKKTYNQTITEMKKGDKVKIVALFNAHGFKIGHVGEITDTKRYSSGLVIYEVDHDWWVEACEIVSVEPDKSDEKVSQ